MFIVESPDDARLCASSGIFDFALFETECQNCAIAIGPLFDVWVPTAVVSDQLGRSWPMCIDCASPMIFPGEWFA